MYAKGKYSEVTFELPTEARVGADTQFRVYGKQTAAAPIKNIAAAIVYIDGPSATVKFKVLGREFDLGKRSGVALPRLAGVGITVELQGAVVLPAEGTYTFVGATGTIEDSILHADAQVIRSVRATRAPTAPPPTPPPPAPQPPPAPRPEPPRLPPLRIPEWVIPVALASVVVVGGAVALHKLLERK